MNTSIRYNYSDIEYLEKIRKTNNVPTVDYFLDKPEYFFNLLNTGIAVKDLTDITPSTEKYTTRRYIHTPTARTFECTVSIKPNICGCAICNVERTFSWKEITKKPATISSLSDEDLLGLFDVKK